MKKNLKVHRLMVPAEDNVEQQMMTRMAYITSGLVAPHDVSSNPWMPPHVSKEEWVESQSKGCTSYPRAVAFPRAARRKFRKEWRKIAKKADFGHGLVWPIPSPNVLGGVVSRDAKTTRRRIVCDEMLRKGMEVLNKK